MKSFGEKTPRFNGGEHVKDAVTGFEGRVTAFARYVTGCDQYLVTPRSVDNKPADALWFDDARLKRGSEDLDLTELGFEDSENGAMESAPVK